MKRSWLFLMLGVSSFAPRAAWALPSETVFELRLVNGPNEVDATSVATVRFRMTEDVGWGCRYSAGWQGTYDGAFSTPCAVDEFKTHGHQSCVDNANEAFATLLVKPARSDCAGFDTMARTLDIAMLVALVMPDGPTVVGLLMWAGGAPFPVAFEASPEG